MVEKSNKVPHSRRHKYDQSTCVPHRFCPVAGRLAWLTSWEPGLGSALQPVRGTRSPDSSHRRLLN